MDYLDTLDMEYLDEYIDHQRRGHCVYEHPLARACRIMKLCKKFNYVLKDIPKEVNERQLRRHYRNVLKHVLSELKALPGIGIDYINAMNKFNKQI